MQILGHFFQRIVRWVWLGTLIFLAYQYLSSGLSRNKDRSGSQSGNPIANNSDLSVANQSERTKDQSTSSPLETAQSLASIQRSVAMANQVHGAYLHKMSLDCAETADWLTICRRLSLALVGNGLSLEEIRSLEQEAIENRVQIHLQNLLADSRHHHYWAERWARYLVGTDGGQFIVYRRRRFRIWLSEVIAENRPYDQIVRDLLTAEGLWTDRPEVNFYTATFDSNDGSADPVRLAARTARVFLGLRIDCLQCHDDFLGNVNLGDELTLREGKQQDFHQLAAFFTGAKTNGLQGIKSGDSDYHYQYLKTSLFVSRYG